MSEQGVKELRSDKKGEFKTDQAEAPVSNCKPGKTLPVVFPKLREYNTDNKKNTKQTVNERGAVKCGGVNEKSGPWELTDNQLDVFILLVRDAQRQGVLPPFPIDLYSLLQSNGPT